MLLIVSFVLSSCFGGGLDSNESSQVSPFLKIDEATDLGQDESYKGDEGILKAGTIMLGQVTSDLKQIDLNLTAEDIEIVTNGAEESVRSTGTLAIGGGASLSLARLNEIVEEKGLMFGFYAWGNGVFAEKEIEINRLYLATDAVANKTVENVKNSKFSYDTKQAILKTIGLASIKGSAKVYTDDELKDLVTVEDAFGAFNKISSIVFRSIKDVGVSKSGVKDFSIDYANAMIAKTKVRAIKSDDAKNMESILSGLAAASVELEYEGQEFTDSDNPRTAIKEAVFEVYNKETSLSLDPSKQEDFDIISEKILSASIEAGSETVGKVAEFVTEKSIVDYGATPLEVSTKLSKISQAYAANDRLSPPSDIGLVLKQDRLFDNLETKQIISADDKADLIAAVNVVASNTAAGIPDSDGDGVADDKDLYPFNPHQWLPPKIFSNSEGAYAALTSSGRVKTFGNIGGRAHLLNLKNVDQVFSNRYAYAALLDDKRVVTWGDTIYGGDSSVIESQLTNVVSIQATEKAFAALKSNGSVVTWGWSGYGGHSGNVSSELSSGVEKLFSTKGAFAALKTDGSVVIWGYGSFGANIWWDTAGFLDGDVLDIVSTDTSFAAIKANESAWIWGDGSSNDSLYNVDKIISNKHAFAVLKTDGSVQRWGNNNLGGVSSSPTWAGQSGVQEVYSFERGFAAKKEVGSVETWGDFGSFPIGLDFTKDLILSNGTGANISFAALKSNGSVVTWGYGFTGGNSSNVSSELSSGVVNIFASGFAFAALKSDGSVVTWGDGLKGGDSSSVSSKLSSGVENIVATLYSFIALKSDGSLVGWGGFYDTGIDTAAVSERL